jgi:hypothetical protein
MYLFLGFLGVFMIAAWPRARHLDLNTACNLFGCQHAKEECGNRMARNTVLLSSGLCDRGTHELEMQDVVLCDKARKDVAWGMTACVFTARFNDSVLADVGKTLYASWTAVAIGTLLLAVAIRAYFGSRAEIAKHRMTLETQQKLLLQQTQYSFLQQLSPQKHHWNQSHHEKSRQMNRLRHF